MVVYTCNALDYKNEMCAEKYNNGASLVFHMKKCHRLYACSDCEFVSDTRYGLDNHEHIGEIGARSRKKLVNNLFTDINKCFPI